MIEKLAHACMCAKCVELDSDFRQEVAALVRDLSPAECERATEIVRADRETQDELKDMIEGYRLESRYDYLLDALTVRGIASDDCQAACMHLAAGRPIYYADRRYPDGLVKRSPNSRKQLVSVDGNGVISVIRELP